MSRLATIVARLLEEARSAIDAGDKELAAERLLDVLEIDPGNVAAQQLLDDPQALGRRRVGERKQLTIVFTDQVGSTPFVERHGGEATTRVHRLYHELFGRAVESHGGLIQGFQGDGLVACFGHPIAHEDDAARALDASLLMMASLEPLERMVADELDDRFEIRVGVHTGEVVVAELGTEASPLPNALTGVTPNVASRLQDLAGPGEILVSAATADVVGREYRLEPNGHHRLKGVSKPMETFRLDGKDDKTVSGNPRFLLCPLVGRRDEVSTLSALWDEVRSGLQGRAVLVTGRAGIGKSRLLNHTRDLCLSTGGWAISALGRDAESALPMRYLTRALEHHFGALDEATLRSAGLTGDEAAAVLALDTPLVAAVTSELEPGVLRRRSLVVLERWLERSAASAPLSIILDDFQWADATTRAWMVDYAARLPSGVFLVVASRQDEADLPTNATLALQPLPGDDARHLVTHLVGGQHDVVDEVVANADGVPLFLEELAQAGTPDRIPASLREVVQAELEPESLRFFAQLMATIGRSISYSVLVDVAAHLGYGHDEVDRQLTLLLDKGVIEPNGAGEYSFRHHLVWQAAYDSQLSDTQIGRHGSVAEAVSQHAEPDTNPLADLAGRQYLLARRPVEGCTSLLGAVAQSQLVGAHGESLQQLELVAAALADVPPEIVPVFDVGLRMRRALSTAVTSGYADPAVRGDFEVASTTSRALLQVPELQATLVPALMGLWSYYAVAGDFTESRSLIADLVAADLDDDWNRVVTVILGMDHFFRGELVEAHELLATVEHELDVAPAPAGWSLPNDPSVCGLAVAAAIAILQGDADGSVGYLERALSRADVIPFPVGPLSAALTHTYVAMAQGLVGNHDLQADGGAAAMSIAQRHGFVEWLMLGEIHSLSGRALSGEAALAGELAASIGRWRATGAGVCVPALLGFQAELAADSGHSGEALELLAEAEAMAAATAQGLGLDRLISLEQRLSDQASEALL